MSISPASSTDPLEPVRLRLDAASLEKEGAKLSEAARTRRIAWALTLAGGIPFLGLSLSLVLIEANHPLFNLIVDLLKTYAAIILSFLGGIRWGLAMRDADVTTGQRVFILSVVPSLVGWFAILLPTAYAFAVLALSFAAQGAWDTLAAQKGVFGQWFARLRTVITTIVVACMVIAFFATV